MTHYIIIILCAAVAAFRPRRKTHYRSIDELTVEQAELIRIAASVVCESQAKQTEQSRFLRSLAMQLDTIINETND